MQESILDDIINKGLKLGHKKDLVMQKINKKNSSQMEQKGLGAEKKIYCV